MSSLRGLFSPSKSPVALSLTYLSVVVLLLCPTVSLGQAGTPAFVPMDSSTYDSVDLQNLNVLVHAPMFAKTGAFPLTINFYANSFCSINGANTWECGANSTLTNFGAITANNFMGGTGWATAYPLVQGTYPCTDHTTEFKFSQWVIQEANGTQHPLPPTDQVLSGGDSTCRHTSITDTAIDGSGLTITIAGGSSGYNANPLVTSGGMTVAALYPQYSNSIKDANGNAISTVTTSTAYYDTLSSSTAAATASPSVMAPTSISWTDVLSGSPTVSVTYSNVKWQTNFGCSGVTDIPPGSSTSQISGLSYPDGSSLGITYEATPGKTGYVTGRIGQLTLPTGGTISYAYTTACNGQVTGLVRTTSYGQTKYTSSSNPTTGAVTTTVIDNGGNATVYYFSAPNTYGQAPLIEVERYLGAAIASNLLRTDEYCYNYSSGVCQSPVTLPVTSLTVSSKIGSQWRQSTYTYDTYGNVLTDAEYDFGVSSPTTTSTTVYGSWNGSACVAVSSTINNRPCTRTVTSGSSTLAQSRYTYDSYGNLLTTYKWNGTLWLSNTTANTYNSNGTPSYTYDLANNKTSYLYNGTGGCNNLFPTSITKGGLTVQYTWNCTGGVLASITDANGNVTNFGYANSSGIAEPFWRLSSMTDPLSYEAWESYTPTSTNVSFTFNSGASAINVTNTLDSYGRPINTQTANAPSPTSYDTISQQYGWSGGYQSVTSTLPCSTTTLGAQCSFSSNTTVTDFDPLGRVYSVTDGGNGTLTQTYPNNDLLSALGPATTGENTKSVQNEYDGLGRLKSVCGIMVSGGYTSCSQTTGTYSGQFTTYSYAYGTGTSSETATRGSQTRSETFDALGRVTTIITPEAGTTHLYYDSLSSGCSGSTNTAGRLIEKVDNINTLCYSYDQLGRVISINANGTACRQYYYDNSTGFSGTIPSGISILYPSGRLVEAATTNCGSTLITDEWFSYDKNGNVADMWEKTPNAGQYYHSKSTFYGNGVPNVLTLSSPSLFNSTYNLDGEGRWNQLTTYGQTIVPSSGVTFNPASQPTQINIGTGTDNDAYTYDGASRMKTWEFTVGTKNESAQVNWNDNWTVNNLAITDGFNSGGTQTCYFNPSGGTSPGYDDLGRLLNDNCASVWAQTFTYDQYDNVTKAGSITFNPGYSGTQYASSFGGTYDLNGDLTYDTFNYYAWNEFAKLKSVNVSGTNCATSGQCLVYDAFGRVVEIDSGSSSTEIWYTQLGKTAYMNGSAFKYAYWPTPGNGTLLQNYNGSGYSYYYEHADWLGSARISSNLGTTIIDDRAFAPYGELYNNFGSTSANENIFTGDTQDVLATLDCCFDTPNRELSSTQGRWLSPDPAGSGWNPYAYVTNPNTLTDPSGLCGVLSKIGSIRNNFCSGGSGGPTYDDGLNDGLSWAGGGDFDPDSPWYPGSSGYTGNDGFVSSGGGMFGPAGFIGYIPPEPISPFWFYTSIWVPLLQTIPDTEQASGNGAGVNQWKTTAANNGLRGAALARCAAKFSNDHSLAAGLESLTGGAVSKDNLLVNALLGSDAATLSNIITGPDRGQNLLSRGISQGTAGAIKVVGNLPSPGASALAGTVTVSETAGGTAFAASWTDATIATSLLGRTAGKAFAVFSISKAIWDGSTYIFGLVQCH